MRSILRNLTRCLVCGFSEIRTDEVVDRGLLFLAECPRCEHRWTSAVPFSGASEAPNARAARAPLRVGREVVPAA